MNRPSNQVRYKPHPIERALGADLMAQAAIEGANLIERSLEIYLHPTKHDPRYTQLTGRWNRDTNVFTPIEPTRR